MFPCGRSARISCRSSARSSARRPDVIFSTVVGDSTVHLYQSYSDAGFDPKTLPIASLTTTEAEIRAMGFDVGEGHITAASYFQNIDSASNASFVSRFKKRFGAENRRICASRLPISKCIFLHAHSP